jgi:hypothetical protein
MSVCKYTTLFLLILTSGCDDRVASSGNIPPTVMPEGDIWPVSDYNGWVVRYRHWGMDEGLWWIDSLSTAEDNFCDSVPGEWRRTETPLIGGDYTVAYFRNDSAGLWRVTYTNRFSPDSITGQSIYLKYPGRPGDTWNFVSNHETVQCRLVSFPRTIQVPAGVFTDCVEYEFEYEDGDVVTYYCRAGVGPVMGYQMRVVDEGSPPIETARFELVSTYNWR